MRGLQIEAGDGEVTLDDILRLCDKKSRTSIWTCRDLEVDGYATQALTHAAEESIRIPGDEFLELIADIDRVVEGDFTAFERGAAKHWLLIRAIDGDTWEVFTRDRGLLTHIEATFRNVRRAEYG